MSGELKKAALLVHGLSGADQRWILDRLPAEMRGRMTPLLTELKELGFDTSGLQDISEDALARLPASAPDQADKPDAGRPGYGQAVDRVDSCTLQAVIQCASREADWVISQILAHRDWSWGPSFLNALSPSRRRQIEKSSKEAARLPKKMGERLVQQLDLALQKLEPPASHFPGRLSLGACAVNGGIGQWLRSFVRRT